MILDVKSIARCMKPKNFGSVTSCKQLHLSDACVTGYGQSSYVRLINDMGQVHCSLLVRKSRVAPLKFISIHRLELTGATVKVSKMLKDELDIHVHDEVFWTDCQLVLGYTVLIVISVVSKYLLQTECSKSEITPVPSNGIMFKVETTQMMLQEGWIPR